MDFLKIKKNRHSENYFDSHKIETSDVLYNLNEVNIDDNLSYIYKDGTSCKTYPKMLDTNLSFPERLPKNRTIVFDIGGTNLRSAVVSFDENKAVKIEKFSTNSISHFLTDFNTFIDYLISQIIILGKDFEDNVWRIRICFSYPFESTKDNDARIISMSKDVDLRGSKGKLIARPIKDFLQKKRICADIKIINDATAAALYVKFAHPDIDISTSFVYGIIIGTGNNIALLKEDKGQYKIVNTEIGQTSVCKNKVLENITGGKYIYKIINEAILKIGITFDNTAEVTAYLREMSAAPDIKEIIIKTIKKISLSEIYLLDKIIKYQMNKEQKRVVYVNVEGTCYHSLPTYKESFISLLKRAGNEGGYEVVFIEPCENSIMIACATA